SGRESLDRHGRMDVRQLARPAISSRFTQANLAFLLRHAIRHRRDQQRLLSHSVARGSPLMAERYTTRIPFLLEGIEIYHPLEASHRQVPEFDCAHADPPKGLVSEDFRGALP